VLRHPNLLKFLSSYAYEEAIYLLTELVSPLEVVIKSIGDEEMIKGLRDVAKGLQFLHETVSCVMPEVDLAYFVTVHLCNLYSCSA